MTKQSSSLKRRIVMASFAMTFVICLLFSAGLFIAFDVAEEALFEEHLEDDMTTFINQYKALPQITDIPRHNFSAFVAENGDTSGIPEYLRTLPSDADEVVVDGRLLDVEIREDGTTRFYFLIEEAAFESFEQILFIAVLIIIVVICAVAVLLGAAFANRIIRPVTELARRVNNLQRDAFSPPGGLSQGDDEIEVLSHAIDAYQQRVTELIRREREFSSDASHELRTPVMGIQAAAENIQVAAGGSSRVHELARRIEARCRQMGALIESMLVLARDPQSLENDFETLPLVNIVNDQLDSVAALVASKGITVRVDKSAQPAIFNSPEILSVVFGNLLRNAIMHSESDSIHISITDRGFTISDFGHGMSADLANRLSATRKKSGLGRGKQLGIGLSLVRRLCNHFGWTIALDTSPGAGTTITVDFNDSLRAA